MLPKGAPPTKPGDRRRFEPDGKLVEVSYPGSLFRLERLTDTSAWVCCYRDTSDLVRGDRIGINFSIKDGKLWIEEIEYDGE